MSKTKQRDNNQETSEKKRKIAQTFLDKHETLLDKGYFHQQKEQSLGSGFIHLYSKRPFGSGRPLTRPTGELVWTLGEQDGPSAFCSMSLKQLKRIAT